MKPLILIGGDCKYIIGVAEKCGFDILGIIDLLLDFGNEGSKYNFSKVVSAVINGDYIIDKRMFVGSGTLTKNGLSFCDDVIA